MHNCFEVPRSQDMCWHRAVQDTVNKTSMFRYVKYVTDESLLSALTCVCNELTTSQISENEWPPRKTVNVNHFVSVYERGAKGNV